MGPAEQLYLAILHSARRFRELDAPLGLSRARFSVLATVRYHGPQRIGDLAAIEGVSQPTISRLVAGLEADALVVRGPDPSDRRGAVVDLTPQGRALIRQARARKIAWVDRVIRDLPGDVVAELAQRLDAAAVGEPALGMVPTS